MRRAVAKHNRGSVRHQWGPSEARGRDPILGVDDVGHQEQGMAAVCLHPTDIGEVSRGVVCNYGWARSCATHDLEWNIRI